MKRLATIVISIVTSLVTALLVVWFSPALVEDVPSPQRLLLRAQNALSTTPARAQGSFRVVVCWLENDWSGRDTRNVEAAFSGIEGISLVVSAEIITASGAADEWRPGMQLRARGVLERWNADVAVVGRVKQSGETLALWFVPRQGQGTLGRADRPYSLEEATLGADFHEDLRTQLTVMAWNAVAPLADAEPRGRLFETGLQAAAEKLSRLLATPTIRRSEHRAALYVALGDAFSTLGEREPGTGRLEQAAQAYRDSLAVYSRAREPLRWAKAQHSLGLAMAALANREGGAERPRQAVAAYCAALGVFSREHNPRSWAAVHGNLGTVLKRLGELETGTARLEQAIAAHRAALEVFTRERAPDDWAFAQDNLGNVLSILGERTNSTALMEQALDAHRAALEVLTRDRAPLSWATVQHNLGITLMVLARLTNDAALLERSADAFRAALHERTRERAPLDWAVTQNALGKALHRLGERTGNRRFLSKPVTPIAPRWKCSEPWARRVTGTWTWTWHGTTSKKFSAHCENLLRALLSGRSPANEFEVDP